MMMQTSFYTTAEVCEILRIDRRTLHTWRKAQYSGLTWTQIGSHILFPRAQFWQWIDENTVENCRITASGEKNMRSEVE
jgi:excisionase family DNA binding protein